MSETQSSDSRTPSLHGSDLRYEKASDEEKSIESSRTGLGPADHANTLHDSGNHSEKPESDFVVKWDQNDPCDPLQWSTAYKCWVTFQLGMLALAGSLGSSITSPADATIARYVGVSDEVSVLAVSLYMYVTLSSKPLIICD